MQFTFTLLFIKKTHQNLRDYAFKRAFLSKICPFFVVVVVFYVVNFSYIRQTQYQYTRMITKEGSTPNVTAAVALLEHSPGMGVQIPSTTDVSRKNR